jgi:hypothetical protein
MEEKTNPQVERAEGSLFSNSAITSHLERLGYPEISIKSMNKCGKHQDRFVVAFCGCGTRVFPLSHRCNLRTCPRCSGYRKKRIRSQYLPFLRKHPQTHREFLYFLTISPKNYLDLEEGLEHLRASFSKFLRLKYVKERVKAGLYVVEAKKRGDSWNVHLHAIVYGRFLDNRIRGKCLDCGQNLIKFDYETKEYFCASKRCMSRNVVFKKDSKIVDLFMRSSGREVNMHVSRQGSSLFTLNYLLKYISVNKGDFGSPADQAVYMSVMRKRRLIHTFGMFYKHKPSGEILHVCWKCKQKVEFVCDPEAVALYKAVKPPPRGIKSYC